MDPAIDSALARVKAKHGITKFELEKIMDSQWKVLVENMQGRHTKVVNVMYIGKFKPTSWFKNNRSKFSRKYKKDKDDKLA